MKNDLTITVQMPPKAIVRAMFERCLEALPDDAPGDIVAPRKRAELPAIGGEYQGGKYAGLTVHDTDACELILLPGEFNGPWKDAMAWAKQQGGVLPSRFDALVLFTNLKGEFKEEWYWTSEQPASYPGYAWIQSFSSGSQPSTRTGSTNRARAVRRVTI